MAMKEFLKERADGAPGLVIFPDCQRLIRDLEVVQHDRKNPSDVAGTPHEYTHSPDAIRYLCAFRTGGDEEPGEKWEDDNYAQYLIGQGRSESLLRYG